MNARPVVGARREERGIALLAVLVLLGILLAMLGPFMMTMGQAGNDAYAEASESEADLLVDAARRTLIQRVARTQGREDVSPDFDGLDEFPPRLELAEAGTESPLGNRRRVSGEIIDLQGRIHAPTAPLQVWSNLFGLSATLAKDLDKDEEDLIEASGLEAFPDQGYIWIDQELIRYTKKGPRGFEGLERGVLSGDEGAAPDPYGPAILHIDGTAIVDARVRLLVTAQFDDGQEDRSRFWPWKRLEDLRTVDRFERGALDLDRLESLRAFLTFEGARPIGSSFSKPERIFSQLVSGETSILAVRDPASITAGSIVRIRVQDQYEWALVVGITRGGPRRTTVAGPIWNVVLHRVTKLNADEGMAVVEALQPVPINVNTAPVEVVAAVLMGVRQFNQAVGTGDHRPLRVPLSKSKAQLIAERIVQLRGASVAVAEADAVDPNVRPYECFEDLATRVLFPLVENEKAISQQELQYVYTALLHGTQTKLDRATIPITFTSAGLVQYRVAGAVYSGIGATLAARERQGVALPQPSRGVDHFLTSQNDLDEATRTSRSRNYWQTGPRNTTVRIDQFNEPPDLSIAHLFSYLHGKAARFPDRDPGSGTARLAVARAPRFLGENATWSFEAGDHPEGRDVRREGAFQEVIGQGGMPGASGGGNKSAGPGGGNAPQRVLPMYMGDAGLGLGFGCSFWMHPEQLGNQTLFDLPNRDRVPFRNRVFATIENNEVILRLFDVAGLDPDPGRRNPTETAVQWRVPVAGNGIAAQLWTHVGIEVSSGSADGVLLFTDGALKGRPRYATHLGVELPEWNVTGGTNQLTDRGKSPPLLVEDTEGWPPEGVVEVGNELIEYVDIAGNTLITARQDSRGGRLARQDLFEYDKNQGNGGNSNQTPSITVPMHPRNAGVKLYGYSNRIAEGTVVVPGQGEVQGGLGPWGVARVMEPLQSITFARSSPGRGMDEKFMGQVRVASPEVGAKPGGNVPGFDPNGGYAVLVQVRLTTGPAAPEPDEIGGVEVVRYEGFNGDRLSIVERAVSLDPDLKGGAAGGLIAAQPRKFVTEWQRGTWGTQEDPNEYPQLWTFMVPISISVGGLALVDPSQKGHSEWIQLRSPGREADLEWVRYDFFDASRGWVVRSRLEAVLNLQRHLIRNPARVVDVRRQGNNWVVVWDSIDAPVDYVDPPTVAATEIGYPDPMETGNNLPHYEARTALRFRGDPGVGTSSHAQAAGAIVTPVFRTFLGSVHHGRPGRGDRVTLVTGANGTAPPAVEWNTVTWSSRNWQSFTTGGNSGGGNTGGGNTGGGGGQNPDPDPPGPRGNLVALERGVSVGYLGQPFNGVQDGRLFDRLVKFPSGELPLRLADPVFGGNASRDLPDLGGLIDDVQGYAALAHDARSNGDVGQIVGVVAIPAREADMTLSLMVSRQLQQAGMGLRGGGLVAIDGEIVGVRSFNDQTGELQVATNGRGMLGSEPRAHDVGARVHFVSCRPATALSSMVPASLSGFMVDEPSKLAQNSGTFLVNQELVHYSWVRGTLFEMPQHEKRELGLFRGRYGTAPAQHDAGSLAIHWPIRYWDRYEAEADDPEQAWLGFSYEAPNLYVTEVVWTEQIPDPLLDIICYVRADARVPFTELATGYPLWRFDDPVDPQSATGRPGHKILAQAGRWDFRFAVDYKPGAFEAQTFRATAWKRTPSLQTFAWSYQAATSVLDETETLR